MDIEDDYFRTMDVNTIVGDLAQTIRLESRPPQRPSPTRISPARPPSLSTQYSGTNFNHSRTGIRTVVPPTLSTSNQSNRRLSNSPVSQPPVVNPPKPRQVPTKTVEKPYDYRTCAVSKSYKGLLLVVDDNDFLSSFFKESQGPGNIIIIDNPNDILNEKESPSATIEVPQPEIKCDIECGFTLPRGYRWNPTFVDGLKEGKTDVFDPDNRKIATLSYSHDLLNGNCLYFQDGILTESRPYVNDFAEGWSIVYSDGNEKGYYLYQKGIRVKHYTHYESGFYKCVDLNNLEAYYLCKLDENKNRTGVGYLMKNNELTEAVEFDNDNVDRKVKEFYLDNHDEMNDPGSIAKSRRKMKEYDKDGNLIYDGEYDDDLVNDYPRKGQGREFYLNTIIYEGKWKNNMRCGRGRSYKGNTTYYIGDWKDGIPEGKGQVFNTDTGITLYSGDWKNGTYEDDKLSWHYNCNDEKPVRNIPETIPEPEPEPEPEQKPVVETISPEQQQQPIELTVVENTTQEPQPTIVLVGQDQTVSPEVIPVQPDNSVSQQTISPSPVVVQEVSSIELQPVVPSNNYVQPPPPPQVYSIGPQQFNEYKELTISKQTYNQIDIGEYSFQNCEKFIVSDCPDLKSITIGQESFNMFEGGEFVVQNCPKLESIVIQMNSFFYYECVTLSNLPSLKTIQFGYAVFRGNEGSENETFCVFKELPALTAMYFSAENFVFTESLTISNVSQEFQFQGDNPFQSVHSTNFENFTPRSTSYNLIFDHLSEGDKLRRKLEYIIFDANTGNTKKIKQLKFNHYKKNVEDIRIFNNQQLEVIQVGTFCFDGEMDNGYFKIDNCDSLKEVFTLSNAFANYTDCVITDSPSLERLQIIDGFNGLIHKNNMLDLRRLNSLSEVHFINSFGSITYIRLIRIDLPAVEILDVEEDAFASVEKKKIKDVVKFDEIEALQSHGCCK